MPTWDIVCDRAGCLYQELDAAFDNAHARDRYVQDTVCPTCGSKLRVMTGTPAFYLKGPGFHCNDYPKWGGPTKPPSE